MTPVLTVIALVGAAAIGGYCRWAGWGFGLGWWGRPVPARVLAVRPLAGAVLKGGMERTLVERSHRVAVDLEVEGDPPHRATAITWQRSLDHLGGRTIAARVSRTRPSRVHVPRNAADAPEGDGTY